MLRRVVRKRLVQQRIGFCSTADGARIAYATVGTGPALIFAQWVSHLELEWEEPRVRDFWETIGRHHISSATTSTAVVCPIGTGPTFRSTQKFEPSTLSS